MKSLASRRWICHEFGVNSPLTWAWRKVLRLSEFAFILCGFHFVLVSRGNSAWQSKQSPRQAHNGVHIRNPSCCRWFMPSSGVLGAGSCETPRELREPSLRLPPPLCGYLPMITLSSTEKPLREFYPTWFDLEVKQPGPEPASVGFITMELHYLKISPPVFKVNNCCSGELRW